MTLFLSSTAPSEVVQQAKILPLGDSITRGNNDINYPYGDIPGGYRKELAEKLTAGNFSFDFVGTISDNGVSGLDPHHEGHPGFRTDEILANLPAYMATQPDTVLLMIGTNDILQGRSVTVAASNLRALIAGILQGAPRRRLYVGTIIPITQNWQGRPAATLNANVDAYNVEVRNVVAEMRQQGRNATLVDLHDQLVLTGNTPAENFFQPGDGVHPGQAGYDQLGRFWYQAITSGGAILDVPATPSGLTAMVVSPSRVNLQWGDSAIDEGSYQIRVRRLPDGAWDNPIDLAADSVNHACTGLSTGAYGYAFSVRAANEFGPSNWSAEATTAIPSNLAESKPAGGDGTSSDGHGAENANDGRFDTHWIADPSSTTPSWTVDLGQSYHLQRLLLTMRQDLDVPEERRNFEIQASNDPQFTSYKVLASRVAEPLPNAATWDVAVDANPPCRYVRIAKTVVEGLSLAEFNVFGSPEMELPLPPAGAIATMQGDSTALVTWVTVSNMESGFRVERKAIFEDDYQEVGTASPNSPEFMDSGLLLHTRYFYRVVAINEAGESAPSAEISVATGPASTYLDWCEAYPEFGELPDSEKMPTADPNKDGQANLMAYAFGADPLAPLPPAATPGIESIPGSSPPRFEFRFRRQIMASDLRFDVMTSSGLEGAEWSIMSLEGAEITAVPDAPGIEEVRIPVDLTSDSRRFFRLRLNKMDSNQ